MLQLLLKFCCSDKCHSKLAEVVKLAKTCGLTLDKTFCESVLKELQQWGQDQEAVATVVQALKSPRAESGVGVAKPKKGTCGVNQADAANSSKGHSER